MPTFTSSAPISVALEFESGGASITASERADTIVDVRPRDASREADVQAAQATDVEFAAGRLVVRGPRGRGRLFGRAGAIDVSIELPEGSDVEGKAGMGDVRAAGSLGRCRLRSGAGDVRLEQASELSLQIGMGAVAVHRVTGGAEIATGAGTVRVEAVDGNATVKNSNGSSWIGTVGGDLRVQAANGDIDVARAGGSVSARTANGAVRVGGLARGTTSLKTGNGMIEVGIAGGTAARLDVLTRFGRVENRMEASDGPAPGDGTVEVQARTANGDIVIRRD